jgi:hypothetical protein
MQWHGSIPLIKCSDVLAWMRPYGRSREILGRRVRYGALMATNAGIISTLVGQANGTTDISRAETQAILRDAAKLIATYRQLLAFSGVEMKFSGCDLAIKIEQFAEHIDLKYVDEIRTVMLEAADAIRLLRLMLGIKTDL